MRAAADWQLEQVIKWIWEKLEEDPVEDVDFCCYITDNIVDELLTAMRPQQQDDN